ncbi:hypothetical protein AB6B38_07055 [Glycocaulis abyssi]|uniref:Cyclic di-GMP-binding protein n=1 Tax=Glycocaulis abyssi TaxID=1433403 RepID=A0ABV9NCT5_9PROT
MTIQARWWSVMCMAVAIAVAVPCVFSPSAGAIPDAEASAASSTPAAPGRIARSEERTLASLTPDNQTAHPLDASTRELRIPFTLAPGSVPESVELVLSARPVSARSGGRLEALLAGSRTIALTPRADSFEARFSLYSDSLRAGENVLVIRFDAGNADGWQVDLRASRLRVTALPSAGHETLEALETALAAHFAAPRRIFVDASGSGRERLAVEALVAQGLALRMGQAPVLVERAEAAELVVRAAMDPLSPNASIALADPYTVRLAGAETTTVAAAARLFAARSFVGTETRMTPATALPAPRLTHIAPGSPSRQDNLQALAESGIPFARENGGRAAIILAGDSTADRLGALSLLSRASLVSGSAWLYAWYGSDAAQAPADHDLFLMGPIAAIDPRLVSAAPAEVRAATEAANRRVPRERRSYGSTAFADEGSPVAGAVTGIGALYREADGRTIVLLTAPEGADFSRAARRLAHSDLWRELQGRAVLWDAGSVTAFGPTAQASHALSEQLIELFRQHDRLFALIAFALAVLLLFAGNAVNRRSTRSA